MTHLSPIENLFAVEVPEDAKNITIKNGAYVKWLMIDGSPFVPINDPAKFRILFTTKGCSEEQAEALVGRNMAGLFEHYGSMWDLSGLDGFDKAIESLQSLLRANGLKAENNYLLIKKIA